MPRPQRYLGALRLQSDFIEADLAAGFTLLSLAETESDSGAPANVCHAIEAAQQVYLDGQARLAALDSEGPAQARRLRPQLEQLRGAIDFYSLVLDHRPGSRFLTAGSIPAPPNFGIAGRQDDPVR